MANDLAPASTLSVPLPNGQSMTLAQAVTTFYQKRYPQGGLGAGTNLLATAPAYWQAETLTARDRITELEQALVTMTNQLADANRTIMRLNNTNAWLHAIGPNYKSELPSDPPQSDSPEASPNRGVVDQVVDALDKRLVGRSDRVRLRGALDKADAPLTGRAASDEALGRIARLGALQGDRR